MLSDVVVGRGARYAKSVRGALRFAAGGAGDAPFGLLDPFETNFFFCSGCLFLTAEFADVDFPFPCCVRPRLLGGPEDADERLEPLPDESDESEPLPSEDVPLDDDRDRVEAEDERELPEELPEAADEPAVELRPTEEAREEGFATEASPSSADDTGFTADAMCSAAC